MFSGLTWPEQPHATAQITPLLMRQTKAGRHLVWAQAHVPWDYPDTGTLLTSLCHFPCRVRSWGGQSSLGLWSHPVGQPVISSWFCLKHGDDCALGKGFGNGCTWVKSFNPEITAEDTMEAALWAPPNAWGEFWMGGPRRASAATHTAEGAVGDVSTSTTTSGYSLPALQVLKAHLHWVWSKDIWATYCKKVSCGSETHLQWQCSPAHGSVVHGTLLWGQSQTRYCNIPDQESEHCSCFSTHPLAV